MSASLKSFSVSINPTYKCSLGCKFCYLGNLRSCTEILSISKLRDRLSNLKEIDTVDIYGGELNELKEDYLENLFDCVKEFNPKTINITTNLSRISSTFLDPDIRLYVSWDYIARSNWQESLSNLKRINRPFSIITLATHMIAKEPLMEEYINILNTSDYLESVEIKPYSPNKDNSTYGSEQCFERMVKYLILNQDKQFILTNKSLMNQALDGQRPNIYDHVFINPYGEYCILDFDERGREYFRIIQDINEIQSKEIEDIVRMANNPKCKECKYTENCLSEHINYNTCTGHKDLLEWYERMEISTHDIL